MGSPRKLREDSNVLEKDPVVLIDGKDQPTPKPSKFKPYLGPSSLVPGEPRFFVNGRKLLRVIKTIHCYDENKKPQYKISRTLFRIIYDTKREGKQMRAQLKKLEIPGA